MTVWMAIALLHLIRHLELPRILMVDQKGQYSPLEFHSRVSDCLHVVYLCLNNRNKEQPHLLLNVNKHEMSREAQKLHFSFGLWCEHGDEESRARTAKFKLFLWRNIYTPTVRAYSARTHAHTHTHFSRAHLHIQEEDIFGLC